MNRRKHVGNLPDLAHGAHLMEMTPNSFWHNHCCQPPSLIDLRGWLVDWRRPERSASGPPISCRLLDRFSATEPVTHQLLLPKFLCRVVRHARSRTSSLFPPRWFCFLVAKLLGGRSPCGRGAARRRAASAGSVHARCA